MKDIKNERFEKQKRKLDIYFWIFAIPATFGIFDEHNFTLISMIIDRFAFVAFLVFIFKAIAYNKTKKYFPNR
jgi:hypothetical protein